MLLYARDVPRLINDYWIRPPRSRSGARAKAKAPSRG
jgi:hypothetical protein